MITYVPVPLTAKAYKSHVTGEGFCFDSRFLRLLDKILTKFFNK